MKACTFVNSILLLATVLFVNMDAVAQERASLDVCSPDESEIDIPELCDELEREYRNKKDRSIKSTLELLSAFRELYPDANESDQKKIVKVCKKALTLKPITDTALIHCQASRCLEVTGKHGLKALLAARKSRILEIGKKWTDDEIKAALQIRASLLESIASFKDTKTLKIFYEELQDDNDEIVIAVCDSLALFEELPLKERKPIVEQLIKRYDKIISDQYGYLKNPKRFKKTIPQDRKDWTRVKMPLNDSLQALTGQRLYTAKSWRTWFQIHKNEKEWKKGEYSEENPWRGTVCPVGKTGRDD